jgi:hypothetical protein
MTDAKPAIGEFVHFYDPHLVMRVGFAEGYGGRGVGPYAAIVVNDQDSGLDLHVLYPAKQPAFVQDKVRERPADDVLAKEAVPKPYWDWTNASQKARAVKRASEA